MLAMEHDNLECLKLVLEHRAKELGDARPEGTEQLTEGGLLSFAANENAKGLSKAIEGHHWDVVDYMLEFDIDVNTSQQKSGSGLLHLAAESGRTETVFRLLAKGARVDGLERPAVKDRKTNVVPTKTPLMRAASCGHLESVKLLCEHGADVNATWLDEHSGQFLSPAYFAAREGHPGCLKYLLEKRPLSEPHLAVMETMCKGSVQCLELLFIHGFSASKKFKWGCHYALTEASQKGYEDCVKLLIERGANINAQDRLGPALVYAAMNRQTCVANLLLDAGAQAIAKKGKHGALWYATQHGELDLVKRLLASGADPNWRGPNEETAIFIAADLGHTQCLKEILAHKQTSVKILNDCGHSAIVGAIRNQKLDCVAALLAANLDPNLFRTRPAKQQPSESICPLMWAIFENYPSCVDFLLSHGANPYTPSTDCPNAFQYALKKNKPQCLRVLLEFETAESKKSARKDSKQDETGQTQAWKLLILRNKPRVCKNELLRSCTFPTRRASTVSSECIELLLQFGADVNHVEFKGGKPGLSSLEWSLETANVDHARVLLRHNADLSCLYVPKAKGILANMRSRIGSVVGQNHRRADDGRTEATCVLILAAGYRPGLWCEAVPEQFEDFRDILAFHHNKTLLQLCRAKICACVLSVRKGNMFGLAQHLPVPKAIARYLVYDQSVDPVV